MFSIVSRHSVKRFFTDASSVLQVRGKVNVKVKVGNFYSTV